MDAATRLPFRHISVRVPWHDSGLNGTDSSHPKQNASCLVLDQMRPTQDDSGFDLEHWNMGDGA
jgi:hypothetical protein